MNNNLAKVNLDQFTSDMVDYISNSGQPSKEQRFHLNSWYIKRTAEMLQDSYTPDSYFYDFVEYTAHMGYVEERLDNPERPLIQFLVPIDFHF
jgi:hypothetical protein